jgi:hypothetical protein
MAETYQSFVLGYMVLWFLLFGGLTFLFLKTKKTERLLNELEKQITKGSQ